MRAFWFAGHSSREYGLGLNAEGVYSAPERDTSVLEVPGRTGTLTVDNGRWKNGTVTYRVFAAGDGFAGQMRAVRTWLAGAVGYNRLEDEYEPDTYRMARLTGGVDWEVEQQARCGQAVLAFDCWPQRFLRQGEQAQPVTNGGRLFNPTGCPAAPLLELTLTGDARLQVGGTVMAISGYTGRLLLDADTQNAYNGQQNLNRYVTAPKYPTLEAGETEISWTGGIAALQITPRWWSL